MVTSNTTHVQDAKYGNALDVCDLLKISKSTLERLMASDAIPRPACFGRCRRWNLDEIRRWMAAGCPSRAQWDAMQS